MSAFDFFRFLTVKDARTLSALNKWSWISSFGIQTQKSVRHAAHEKWLRTKGNTYRPGHREVMLTLRGQAVYSLNGKCYLRRPGTVILLDRHEERDLKASPEKKGFSCLWLHLYNREYMTFYINSCDASGSYSHELPMQMKSGEASRVILNAWDQCRAEPDNLLCRSLLQSLLVAVLLEILGSTESTPVGNQHERVVESLKDYIAEHLNEDLSLRNLASLAGYSSFFLHRFFQRYTGKTPVQYVNSLRLARAVQLLDEGYKVEAIAEAVGFSSISYFNSFFKKHLGLTPGRWRKSDRKTMVV